MRPIDVAMRRSSLEVDPLRAYRSSSASLSKANNPCEAHVYQQWRLLLMRERPEQEPPLLVDVCFAWIDRKSTRLNSSHANISYAVFCLKKKNGNNTTTLYTRY